MSFLKLLNPFYLLSKMLESLDLAALESRGRIPQIPSIILPKEIFDKDEYLDYYDDEPWEVRVVFNQIVKVRKQLRDNPNLIIPYSGEKKVGNVEIDGQWYRIYFGYAADSSFIYDVTVAQVFLEAHSHFLSSHEYNTFRKAIYNMGGMRITTATDSELNISFRMRRL